MLNVCGVLATLAAAFGPTPAERSNYQSTTSSAEVAAYCARLQAASPAAKLARFGTTAEGRPLNALILAGGPVGTPAEARKLGKPVVLAFANIHAGEVDGKEALLSLARELAVPGHDLLKGLTVVLVPNLNADGNDALDPKLRTDQNGPPVVGTRENAQKLDLNRDFVKLESPEIRALVRLVADWEPLLIIDCHTTNGSYHRYALTYDGPRHPQAHPDLVAKFQGPILAAIGAGVKAKTGFDSFPYGDFSRDHTRWETYPAQPRFGVQYFALAGTPCLLSESYTYSPFPDRVKASRAFVLSAFEYARGHAEELGKLVADARRPRPRVALRTKTLPDGEPRPVFGYVEQDVDGKPKPTAEPKDYQTTLVTKVVATREVPTPAAYLIAPGHDDAVRTLLRHGIAVEELHEDRQLAVEELRVTGVERAARPFQKHSLATVEVKGEAATRVVPAGTCVVRTSQPLGNLAAYLLEPEAEDGLAAWNLFDTGLKVGGLFPVSRVAVLPELTAERLPAVEDDTKAKLPITVDVMLAGGGLGGGRSPRPAWLPDGERFLLSRGGQLEAVDARTGEAKPFFDRAKLRQSLGALGLEKGTLDGRTRLDVSQLNPARTAALLRDGGDYLLAPLDGTPAKWLTRSKLVKECGTLSPTGGHFAFVAAGNLYSVDAATGTETQLTRDGDPAKRVLNGRADWVYEEEIFNRNPQAYWWKPDGSAIAYMRFDDAPVKPFAITGFGRAPELERLDYPKAGAPNPLVSVHVVAVSGASVTLSLAGYAPESTVIARVGWLERPGGAVPFAYVQNRQQTWLDFVIWPELAGPPVKLFRDQTPAWIEDLGMPHPLPDGSFLVTSERSGWKRLYHYAADGKLIRPLTGDGWEVQSVERVDPKFVIVTGTKDSPTATHAYRVSLDGETCDRLTAGGGTHQVTLAPKGPLFVDRFSDNGVPPKLALFEPAEKGPKLVRTLDANPLSARDKYRFGKSERVQVPMPDGFVLEGNLTYPPDFDPAKKYPMWVLTYAGPHAPTVRDGWNPRLNEQAFAAAGVVAFNVDPRSASGKGAKSAWACYKQLGVQELKDLEHAVAWVDAKGWLDPTRVGISGHSYGGTMASYALTHSKVFSAAVAGAPVTDWALYDSIYTERYMGLPSENRAGYKASSVVEAAARLHGKLYLVHGLVDDNVHFQNSAQLIEALQKANKTFEVMVYPGSRHGIGSQHYPRSRMAFAFRAMGVTPP